MFRVSATSFELEVRALRYPWRVRPRGRPKVVFHRPQRRGSWSQRQEPDQSPETFGRDQDVRDEQDTDQRLPEQAQQVCTLPSIQ